MRSVAEFFFKFFAGNCGPSGPHSPQNNLKKNVFAGAFSGKNTLDGIDDRERVGRAPAQAAASEAPDL